MTTREAFNKLIRIRGIYKQLGVDRSTVSNWKKSLIEDKVSLNKMEEMLLKAGWKKAPESWEEGRLS